MKTLFATLLALNLSVGGWLLLYGPVNIVREPGRIGMQVVPEQFRLLSDADVARLRSQADKEAAAMANGTAPAPTVDLPQTDCVLIPNLSPATARKLRARLAEAGLSNRITGESENQKDRLRITGIDEATEQRIHQVLKEFPKLNLEHCIGAAGAH